MFQRESEMSPIVARWLTSVGLQVRKEFVTPWGICDFVGLQFNKDRVAHRLRLKQLKPVSSITRAALLLQVPEIESSESITLNALIQAFTAMLPAQTVESEIERLICDRFIVRSGQDLQKVNGWMPLQKRLIAIELKLARVDEALHQAKCNLGFAEESYVAFPMQTAISIANSRSKWADYFSEGVGLIGVQKRHCKTLIPPGSGQQWVNPAVQLYCVEKFWRTARFR